MWGSVSVGLVLALAAASSAAAPQVPLRPVDPAAARNAAFAEVAKSCAPSIDLTTLRAVVAHESDFNPLAIHVNGQDRLPRQPHTRGESVATAKYLAAHGYSFDSGLAQINSANVARFHIAWEQVFRPCPNLEAGAAILRQCYARASAQQPNQQVALRSALSCYNTGSFEAGRANGYVAGVEVAAGIAPGVKVPALVPMKHAGGAAGTQAADPPPPSDGGTPDIFAHAKPGAFQQASAAAEKASAAPASAASAMAPVRLVPVNGSRE